MKPFGYWHQGDSEDESEFFLFSESGEVACRYCVALYTKQQVEELAVENEELKAHPRIIANEELLDQIQAQQEVIEKLKVRNKRIEDCLVHERTRVADLIVVKCELEYKLAEQQATVKNFFGMYGKDVPNVGEELDALLAKAKEEGRRETVPEDTARLDYLISHDAFVVKREADSGAITYQLWTQNEDEICHALHEESIFLQSPREAIDAAMLAAAPKPHNQD